eukprot:4225631-Prymnesium_polylepis.1
MSTWRVFVGATGGTSAPEHRVDDVSISMSSVSPPTPPAHPHSPPSPSPPPEPPPSSPPPPLLPPPPPSPPSPPSPPPSPPSSPSPPSQPPTPSAPPSPPAAPPLPPYHTHLLLQEIVCQLPRFQVTFELQGHLANGLPYFYVDLQTYAEAISLVGFDVTGVNFYLLYDHDVTRRNGRPRAGWIITACPPDRGRMMHIPSGVCDGYCPYYFFYETMRDKELPVGELPWEPNQECSTNPNHAPWWSTLGGCRTGPDKKNLIITPAKAPPLPPPPSPPPASPPPPSPPPPLPSPPL